MNHKKEDDPVVDHDPKSTKKRPWRAHYTKDWRTDPFVRRLKLEPRAVYLELLDIAWDEGGLRADWIETGEYVAQQIGISRRKFVSIWREIRDKFVEFSPGIWSNPRLEHERKEAEKQSEKQRKNAESRWSIDATALPRGIEVAMLSQSQSQSQSQETNTHVFASSGESPKAPEAKRTSEPRALEVENDDPFSIQYLKHRGLNFLAFSNLWAKKSGILQAAGLQQAGRCIVDLAVSLGQDPNPIAEKAIDAYLAYRDSLSFKPAKNGYGLEKNWDHVQAWMAGEKRESKPLLGQSPIVELTFPEVDVPPDEESAKRHPF